MTQFRYSRYQLHRVWLLRREGLTQARIAVMTGVDQETVRSWLALRNRRDESLELLAGMGVDTSTLTPGRAVKISALQVGETV